jgi:hypothetical protein
MALNFSKWTEEQILNFIFTLEDALQLSNASAHAQKWWTSFKTENSKKPALVATLAMEIAQRQKTINDFFLCYVESLSDNIQANLYLSDYLSLLKEDERKQHKDMSYCWHLIINLAREALGSKQLKDFLENDPDKHPDVDLWKNQFADHLKNCNLSTDKLKDVAQILHRASRYFRRPKDLH